MSGAIETISGYTQEEIDRLDNGWFSVIHPEDVQRIAESVNYNYKKDGIYDNEYRIIDKSGKTRWMLDRSRCIQFDSSTNELTLLGATKDITEHKNILENLQQKNEDFKVLNQKVNKANKDLSAAVKQLSESEEKYRSVIENAPIGVGISKNEKILYANQSLLDIYQIPTFAEFASKKLTDYMPFDSRQLIKERVKKYREKIPQDNVFRHQIIRSDGKVRTVEVTTSEISFNKQKCRQALMTDVTSQIETENDLQKAASIFRNIQIGLLIYRLDDLEDDRSLRLIAVNPASSNLIGIKGEELLDKRIDEIFPNLRKKRIPQQYAEVARNKIPIEFDDIYYEDHRIAPGIFSVKVFPLPDRCVGISFENVSDRRKAEKELLTRNQELNNFVYKVSHDLRAPLSSIKGLINLSKLEQNYGGYLSKIEDRINNLDGFIHDILSHSRNLNSAIIIEKLNLESILDDCFNDLKYLRGYAEIDIQVKIKGNDFFSDRIRVSEICRNMVSNAIKYQDFAKSEKLIKIQVDITEEKVIMVVEDNGIGIESQYLNDIFKMFFRATEESEGSGIGLYIVQQATEKLKGSVSVQSEFHKGTIFTLTIPNMINKRLH